MSEIEINVPNTQKTKYSVDYAREFGEKHPDIGELAGGSTVSAESLRTLGDLFRTKLREIQDKSLSREGDVTTKKERSFVLTSANMLARNLQATIADNPSLLDVETVAQPVSHVLRKAYMSAFDRPELREELTDIDMSDPHKVERGLAAANEATHIGAERDPKQFGIHSSNMTDMINSSMDALVGVAENQGGLPVSHYLQGNLQNMLAHYELLDQGK